MKKYECKHQVQRLMTEENPHHGYNQPTEQEWRCLNQPLLTFLNKAQYQREYP